MSAVLPVIVYGDGSFFADFFRGIVKIIGESAFASMLKITILLAIFTVLFSAISKRNFFVCVRWLGIYYLAFYVLFLPSVTLQIRDRTDGDREYLVDRIPLGLGAIASFTTTIGDALTQLFDKAQPIPQELKYTKSGMMLAAKIAFFTSRFRYQDYNQDQDLKSFIRTCVLDRVLLDSNGMNAILHSENIWQFFQTNVSLNKSFIYKMAVVSCDIGMMDVYKNLQDGVEKSLSQRAKILFPEIKNTNLAKEKLLLYLPITYRYLKGFYGQAHDILEQNTIINAFFEVATDGMYKKAEENMSDINFNTVGLFCINFFSMAKNMIAAMLYGGFIFVILLSFFPSGYKILKKYIFMLFWLQTWEICYSAINFFCLYKLRVKTSLLNTSQITLQNIGEFARINQEALIIAGIMIFLVPIITWLLLRGILVVRTNLYPTEENIYIGENSVNFDLHQEKELDSSHGVLKSNSYIFHS